MGHHTRTTPIKHTIGLTASLLFVLAAGPVAADTAPLGHLSQLRGRVELQHGGHGAWQAAQVGEALYPGDRLRTGPEADAVVLHTNGSLVELMPLGELALDGEDTYEVLGGQLWAKFLKNLGIPDRSIKTPALAALIRGTVLEVGYQRGVSTVVVTEGRVHVVGPHETVADVPAGSAVEAVHGMLEPVRLASRLELDQGARFLSQESPHFREIPRLTPPAESAGPHLQEDTPDQVHGTAEAHRPPPSAVAPKAPRPDPDIALRRHAELAAGDAQARERAERRNQLLRMQHIEERLERSGQPTPMMPGGVLDRARAMADQEDEIEQRHVPPYIPPRGPFGSGGLPPVATPPPVYPTPYPTPVETPQGYYRR